MTSTLSIKTEKKIYKYLKKKKRLLDGYVCQKMHIKKCAN